MAQVIWVPGVGNTTTFDGAPVPPGGHLVSSPSNNSVPTGGSVASPGMASAPTATGNNSGGNSVPNPGMSAPAMYTNTTGADAAAAAQAQARAAAEAARQAKLNALRNTVSGLKTTLQGDFARSQQQINDSRVLNNEQLKRNTNPFSGRTGYQMTNVQREYSQADEAAQKDLQSRMAAYDAQLLNADATSQADMEKQLQAQSESDRAYALQLQQLELQRQKATFDEMNADRNFNLNEGQLTGTYMNPAVAKTLSEILELKRQAEASDNPMQFKDQADKLRAKLATMGVDPSAVGYDNDYNSAVGNVMQNNYGTQTLAAKNQNFNQQMSIREQDFKEGSYKQTFDENVRQFDEKTAIEKAYKDGQLTLDKAKLELEKIDVATRRMNAGTSASNASTGNNIAADRLKLDQDKFEYEKNQGPKQQNLTSYTSSLNQKFLNSDNKVTDREGLERAIIGLPVDNATKASLYNYYGIPMQ